MQWLLWKHDIPRCLTARFLKDALEFEDLHLGWVTSFKCGYEYIFTNLLDNIKFIVFLDKTSFPKPSGNSWYFKEN